jgi:hypothetical protein
VRGPPPGAALRGGPAPAADDPRHAERAERGERDPEADEDARLPEAVLDLMRAGREEHGAQRVVSARDGHRLSVVPSPPPGVERVAQHEDRGLPRLGLQHDARGRVPDDADRREGRGVEPRGRCEARGRRLRHEQFLGGIEVVELLEHLLGGHLTRPPDEEGPRHGAHVLVQAGG